MKIQARRTRSLLLAVCLTLGLAPLTAPSLAVSFEDDPVGVTGVALSGTVTSIPALSVERLTATVEPADATNKAVTWSSSDPAVATVSNGLVTGVSKGAAAITVATADGGYSVTCAVTVTDPIRGIDYDGVTDVIVDGKATNSSLVPGFSINLTKETITIPPAYIVAAYSVNGGEKWKKGPVSQAVFQKMLNKDMTLRLSDKLPDRKTKQPPEDAQIVTFATINKRPQAPKVAANYIAGADPSGDTLGDWVLAKSGTTVVKEDILIGAAAGKAVDAKGYGQFYPGSGNGIPVVAAKRTTYFVKTAPSQSGSVYTAASKVKKVAVAGAQKPANAKMSLRTEKMNRDGTVKTPASATLKVRKNTYARMGDDAPKLYTEKENLDILNFKGTIELWTAGTEKKPPGVKQVITR